MLFSVVIPLYNKERHIGETVRSVLEQDFADFEVLIVDDGSTDNSLGLAREFDSQPKVRVLTKKNGGTASARNLGIASAKGEYLCFLDSDDLWLPGFLAGMQKLVTQFPEAGLYGTAYLFKQGKRLYNPVCHGLPEQGKMSLVPNYFSSILLGQPLITASSVCIPQSVFKEVGTFNESRSVWDSEDMEMWNRIALKYEVAFLNEPLAIYRQDAQNMKSRTVPKKQIGYAAVLEKKLAEGNVPEKFREPVEKLIAANLIGVASMNLLAGDKPTARQFLKDPRTDLLPERKATWLRLLPLPSFLIRWAYRWRTKRQQQK